MARISSLQYVGGKANLIDFVLENLPQGSLYVEPCGGAAWVLLNKPRHPIEVYNDIDGTMVTFFRVLQDRTKYSRLRRLLRYTLYSRAEFARACAILNGEVARASDIDIAWARYVVQRQGFGGQMRQQVGSWGREFKTGGRNGGRPQEFIRHVREHIPAMHERMQNVYIDNRDALEVIQYWDSPDTVFYIDPPYPFETRVDRVAYRHEADNRWHERLIDLLMRIKGSFALSSYPNEIYDRLVDAGVAARLVREAHAHSIGRTRALQNKGYIGDAEWYEMTRRVEALYIKSNGRAGQGRLFL